MAFYDAFKDVINIAQKADNIDLYRKLLDLSRDALDLQNDVYKLSEENERLKKEISKEQEIIRHFYSQSSRSSTAQFIKEIVQHLIQLPQA